MPLNPSTNKKYRQILATGRELFWKHGFRRVSIEEVCKKAGTSKMTFYRYFPNKVALAKAVFDQEMERGLEKFRLILSEDSDAREKIHKMVLLDMESTQNISREFLQDFYGNREPDLQAYIEKRTKQVWDETLGDFKDAQQKGWFRKDFKPEFLFFLLQKMGTLITDEKVLALYPSPQDVVMELSNFVAYGITPRRDERYEM